MGTQKVFVESETNSQPDKQGERVRGRAETRLKVMAKHA